MGKKLKILFILDYLLPGMEPMGVALLSAIAKERGHEPCA